jgi:hypothetical protein
MFYPMRGMEFTEECPPYREATLLGAVNEFVRHVPGRQVIGDDIVAVVEICRACAVEAGQHGCRAPWIYLRPPGDPATRSPHIMALPRAQTLTARHALTAPAEQSPIWILQDAALSAAGDAILRDGTRLYDLQLEPDPLFWTETWSVLDHQVIKEVATFLAEKDPGTNSEALSKLARKVAETKLEALISHVKGKILEGGSEESLRKRLVRIGLHLPSRTTTRNKQLRTDANHTSS